MGRLLNSPVVGPVLAPPGFLIDIFAGSFLQLGQRTIRKFQTLLSSCNGAHSVIVLGDDDTAVLLLLKRDISKMLTEKLTYTKRILLSPCIFGPSISKTAVFIGWGTEER